VSLVRCFPIRILLQSVLNDDLPIPKELVVHNLDGRVAGVEVVVRNERKALRLIRHLISYDLRGANQATESAERVV
jgi:hypothetical protein